ncbi:sugar phosphate isomerase/epimerase [Teredinibacter sp. KSP-S5-2]|uniref:sugar phosphate isomerase/epimerase family protein n=1 Tax=Teredinibacter sp. KSP-S5-2 TaxID=3034506 RepID=UPI00293430F9|nr:sugar phosphate isomerase/epimerase [Teredinibacter sp. KSP-S5-2]WNO11188.1 sugar phosphate isomerase/epimerase [Teredinibacter sp. KSP-S5-2]
MYQRIVLLLVPFLFLTGCTLFSHGTDESKEKLFARPKVSVQLWPLRHEVKTDITSTLKWLSSLGVDGVEFAYEFGEYAERPEDLKRLLDSLNLEVSAAHVARDHLLDSRINQTLAFYKTLGVKTLIIGWDPRAWDPEGVQEFVAELNVWSETLNQQGFSLGVHNHQYEFAPYNGKTFWDYIALNTDESLILQLDVGWAKYAGVHPGDYILRYGNRAKTVHYRALVLEGSPGVSPLIGDDGTNWRGLIASNRAVATEWLVIEQEEHPPGMELKKAIELSKRQLDSYIDEAYL